MTLFRRHFPAAAILLVLPILMLLPTLLPGRDLLPAAMLGNADPWRTMHGFANPPWNALQFDGIVQFYPWRLFAARTLRSGYLPLWNPYQFCGTPLLANDQSAVLYPPNLLFAIMPAAKAFGVSAVLHLFMTGWFLSVFLRRRLGFLSSVLGGAIWQLAAWQISWLALPTFLCSSAWIPLALLLIYRCAERPSPVRAAALGCCAAMMLLAGHIQIGAYGVMVCLAYALVQLFALPAPQRLRVAAAFAGATALSGLLFAPQILPTLELAHMSNRGASSGLSIAGYQAYIALRMPWFHLVTLFSPSFFGRSNDYWGATNYAENACFVSIGALFLAFVAATALWRGKHALQVRFFVCAALFAMLVALGTPAAMFLYFGVPGFGQTASPARILVIWALGIAVLAAYGLEALRQHCPLRPAAWLTLATIAATLCGSVLFVESLAPGFLSRIDRIDIGVSILMTAMVLAAAYVSRRVGFARIGAAALTVLIVLDLFRAGFGYNRPATTGQVYPVTAGIAFLQTHAQQDRIAVVNPPDAVYDPRSIGVLPPNAATVYGLRDLQGYDSLQTRRYKAWVNAKLDAGQDSSPVENGNVTLTYASAIGSAAARSAGGAWVVSGSPIGGLALVSESPGLFIYHAPVAAQPRARIVSPSGQDDAVQILEDRPTRIAVRAPTAGNLVVADQWYPGWRASVNGRAARIRRGPGVFRTVDDIPAGATITMRYQPASLQIGLYLMDIGVAFVCGTMAEWLIRRRRLLRSVQAV